MLFLLIAAILTGTFGNSLTSVFAITGFFGGAARYSAVLARKEHDGLNGPQTDFSSDCSWASYLS